MMPSEKDYVEATEEFSRVLNAVGVIGPALAVRLALIAQDFGKQIGLSREEVSGIVMGAAVMYRALTGKPQ